jgi:hypothetical protein
MAQTLVGAELLRAVSLKREAENVCLVAQVKLLNSASTGCVETV